MQINTTKQKETVYNKTLCEELRNSYRCSDTLSMRCIREGIKWHKSEDKYLETTREEMIAMGFGDVFWSDKVARRVFEMKLKSVSDQKNRFKELLAEKHEVLVDNIKEVSSAGHKGGTYWNGTPKEHNWRIYYFNFKYRESYEVCEEWSEEWTERCELQ